MTTAPSWISAVKAVSTTAPKPKTGPICMTRWLPTRSESRPKGGESTSSAAKKSAVNTPIANGPTSGPPYSGKVGQQEDEQGAGQPVANRSTNVATVTVQTLRSMPAEGYPSLERDMLASWSMHQPHRTSSRSPTSAPSPVPRGTSAPPTSSRPASRPPAGASSTTVRPTTLEPARPPDVIDGERTLYGASSRCRRASTSRPASPASVIVVAGLARRRPQRPERTRGHGARRHAGAGRRWSRPTDGRPGRRGHRHRGPVQRR